MLLMHDTGLLISTGSLSHVVNETVKLGKIFLNLQVVARVFNLHLLMSTAWIPVGSEAARSTLFHSEIKLAI